MLSQAEADCSLFNKSALEYFENVSIYSSPPRQMENFQTETSFGLFSIEFSDFPLTKWSLFSLHMKLFVDVGYPFHLEVHLYLPYLSWVTRLWKSSLTCLYRIKSIELVRGVCWRVDCAGNYFVYSLFCFVFLLLPFGTKV